MPIIKAILTDRFQELLDASENDGLKPLFNIGMVGAYMHKHDEGLLDEFEESYLNAVNRNLADIDYRLASDTRVNVCDLNYKADFLKNAFNGTQLELLVFSCILRSSRDYPDGYIEMKQSDLSRNPENWVSAIKNTKPSIIANLWHGGDIKSGMFISDCIEQTGLYESKLYSSRSFLDEARDSVDMSTNDIGGEIFVKKYTS